MGLPNDKITRSHDQANESHKDPFGFDLAARCFTEQVRESMAKISTMNVNAKTTHMVDREVVKPKDGDLALKATLSLLHDPREQEKLWGTSESRDRADALIDKAIKPEQPRLAESRVAEPTRAETASIKVAEPWKHDYSQAA